MSQALPRGELPRSELPLQFHGWRVNFVVGPGNCMALFVNECLRKERHGAAGETLYVWTNLELQWEEHRWLEARLVPDADDPAAARLTVTVNGEPLMVAEFAERLGS